MQIDIPLRLIAEDLTFIDTTSVNLPNSNEYIIEKVYLNIENGLPLEANIEILLLDENNLVIDTLIDNAKITAAQLNQNNIVSNINATVIEIDYNNFENVKKVISTSSFTTKPIDQFIDIYPNYELGITISAKVTKRIGK